MDNINTDKILNSLSRLKRAEAPGHFYAGIRAKIQRQQPQAGVFLMLKPVFTGSILFIFLIINITVLSGGFKKDKQPEIQSASEGIQSFAKEYNLISQSFGE